MTMKLVAGLFVIALAACGSKSDAPSNTATVGDPPAAPRSGAIDPNAMHRSRPNVPGAAAPADEGGDRPKLDTNGDGKVSPEERDAGKKARAESLHKKLDVDGDGKLTPDELAKSENTRLLRRLGNPQDLDTNKDGEISSDELQQAMERHRPSRGGVTHEATDTNGSDSK